MQKRSKQKFIILLLFLFGFSLFSLPSSSSIRSVGSCTLSTFLVGHTQYVKNSCYYEVGVDTLTGYINYTSAMLGKNVSMINSAWSASHYNLMDVEFMSICNSCTAQGTFYPNKNVTVSLISSSSSEVIIQTIGFSNNLAKIQIDYVFVSNLPYFSTTLSETFNVASTGMGFKTNIYSGYTSAYSNITIEDPNCKNLGAINKCSVPSSYNNPSGSNSYQFSPYQNSTQVPWIWYGNSTAASGAAEGIGIALMGLSYGTESNNPSVDTAHYFSQVTANEVGFLFYGGQTGGAQFCYCSNYKDVESFLVWVNNTPFTTFVNTIQSLRASTQKSSIQITGMTNATYIVPTPNIAYNFPVLVGTTQALLPSRGGNSLPNSLFETAPITNGSTGNTVSPLDGVQVLFTNTTFAAQTAEGTASYSYSIVTNSPSSSEINEIVTYPDIKINLNFTTSGNSDKFNVTGLITASASVGYKTLFLRSTICPDAYGLYSTTKTTPYIACSGCTTTIPSYYTFNYTDFGIGYIFPTGNNIVGVNNTKQTGGSSHARENFDLYALNVTSQSSFSSGQTIGAGKLSFEIEEYSPISSFTPSTYSIGPYSRTGLIYYSNFLDSPTDIGLSIFGNVSSVTGASGNTLATINFWQAESNSNYQFYYSGQVSSSLYFKFSNGTSEAASPYYNLLTKTFTLNIDTVTSLTLYVQSGTPILQFVPVVIAIGSIAGVAVTMAILWLRRRGNFVHSRIFLI